MQPLKGKNIYLRALELEDLSFLSEIENNTDFWGVSDTIQPYSKRVLQDYIAHSHQDIFEAKQLRLVIVDHQHQKIGLVDLFDFDPLHQRVGLGILINQQRNRGKGIGEEVVKIMITYIFEVLLLHQVYVSIDEENKPSIELFKKLKFINCGIKKDWKRTALGYKNVYFYQLINPSHTLEIK